MDLRGIFGGIVEDNRDPQKLGRLKVRVPHVYGAVGGVFGAVTTNDLPWALPCGLPHGLTQASGGADWLPEIGDQVVVSFMDNEPEKPVWQWFMQTQDAAGKFPLHTYKTGSNGSVSGLKRGAWVRYGHTVEWNAEGLIMTTSKGYRVLLTDASSAGNDGDINVATQGGLSWDMDDSTGDATLVVNNDWNINVTNQILAFADSWSLTTSNNEIEFISGSSFTIDTQTDLQATVGENLSLKVTGQSTLDLVGNLTINDAQNITLNATANMALTATANLTLAATGLLSLSSTGALSIASPAPLTLTFSQLLLGAVPISPFVLGDQLFVYLTALYTALLSHTHPGIFPGPANTGTMTPVPPTPVPTMLSTTILGSL